MSPQKIKELIGELEQIAEQMQKSETAPKKYFKRLNDLVDKVKREERGLLSTIAMDPHCFSYKTDCPVYYGRAFLLDNSFQWSLEHTTKGELVLVPRLKRLGTHGDADLYLEGGNS